MRSARFAVVALGCLVFAVAGWMVWSSGGAPSGGSLALAATDTSQLRAPELDSLVVPAMESLDQGQQALDARGGEQCSPVVFDARVVLADGKRGVIESIELLAAQGWR